MRIAFSTETNEGLDAPISQHFGRCPYYVIVEMEGDTIKGVNTIDNPFYNSHGAPGQVPSFIKQQGVDIMISGGMGGRAAEFFEQFGIKPITGASNIVKDALNEYMAGELRDFQTCNH